MKLPSSRSRREQVELQLTPMIDCVFLLMVYFIWSSSFEIAEQSIPGSVQVTSPVAGSSTPTNEPPPPEADFDQVVVRLIGDESSQTVLLNDVPQVSLVALESALATLAAIKSDVPVIVHPDAEIPLGNAIDVYDRARLAGFSQVRFAATER
ncbi:Biopolymer transport protein ExbD/TolR [Pirellula staleyi DSM 6068]|uniref:Biopolymer transport protein ExbD/TolR n=1 Tax=Pirellula staleyi (strain ATCC 27377 / DSM 6068 / ICPB 4128) TaxID=530564 RepID=D2R7F4_PIRSD|nr:biopolymer transporter ExbD [Pirellula staleyi]ADB15650.1 Biopolymer transport protein ExbD/TolR [Pirellula staleyi DSM 6068]